MRKTIFSIAIIALIFLFTSCDKNEELLPITLEAATNMQDYKVRDGFLVFANVESFVEATKFIGNLSNTERQQWESKIGFLQYSPILGQF